MCIRDRPWWQWKEWERFIDWMALNGINMPLAITGQEAVWYKVWSKMGMSDIEIRSYFTEMCIRDSPYISVQKIMLPHPVKEHERRAMLEEMCIRDRHSGEV